MSERDRLSASLEELRQEFDGSFAVAPREGAPDDVALLAIRVGSDSVAVRVHETLGLLKAGRIVAVPSRRPELLGVAGIRGAVIPIYSLARLTGRAEGERPHWIALAGGAERVGLAFAAFEGHVRVRASSIHPADSPRGSSAVSAIVELEAGIRPLLDLGAIVRAVTGITI